MNEILIYEAANQQVQIEVEFDGNTVWLTQQQISRLFEQTKQNVSLHINNCFKEGELEKNSVVKDSLTTAKDGKNYRTKHYNLDVIISVGYRVKSPQGTKFRQWATQRLKDYLVQGYAINQKRLEQKQQEVEFLKTGLRIVSRVIESAVAEQGQEVFRQFAKGLALLDDYDHEQLDLKGTTLKETIYPEYEDYMSLIRMMYADFESSVFAKPKDDGFHSSIHQIRQSFGDQDLYPSIEEKAANLLYFITKNHSFVDGNKRIAAACFLYFLQQNNALESESSPIISNDTLAMLTLYIANSRPEESEAVKRLIISVLNRNK